GSAGAGEPARGSAPRARGALLSEPRGGARRRRWALCDDDARHLANLGDRALRARWTRGARGHAREAGGGGGSRPGWLVSRSRARERRGSGAGARLARVLKHGPSPWLGCASSRSGKRVLRLGVARGALLLRGGLADARASRHRRIGVRPLLRGERARD